MQLRNSTLSGMEPSGQNISSLDDVTIARSKPRLLFFRRHGNLPAFILSQLQQHVKCLSIFFDVRVISENGDYQELCERFRPDLTLVESGVYGSPPDITNKLSCPEVPKLGFLHADAYCPTRSRFLADMERWGIETFFTISVSMPEYLPNNTDQLFIWPNFIDPEIYRDYGQPKNIPVLTTGSQAMHYPWRTRINELAAEQFPSLVCPHFGWFDAKRAARMVYDDEYAKLINAASVVPTCGTVAREVVRKHFEIPACNSCLVTERTSALEDAGFVDMQNCVFATESDVLDKLDYLFSNREVLERISDAGRILVHTRHTPHQRDQIFQWYQLNKRCQPNQRIVQVRPFGPLTLVDHASSERNYQSRSNSMDRAILNEGYSQLRRGNCNAADRSFLSCLNYHRMPEPMLGLALSALHRGDPGAALRSMSRLIRCAFEVDGATEPDPIEWSYFIISLLCNGNVKEAAKRVEEFPSVRHPELDRCRWVIGVLNRTTSLKRPSEGRFSRSSIHQLVETSARAWIDEICEMLTICQQGHLAQQLHAAFGDDQTGATGISSQSGDDLTSEAPPPPGTQVVRSPLRETLNAKIRRRAPKGIRSLLSTFRARTRRVDAFARAVSAWAQEDQISSALLLGASDRSICARAFLEGICKNPRMPHVICLGEKPGNFRKLQREYSGNTQIRFSSKSLEAARIDAALNSFDLVFIDRCVLDERTAVSAIRGAKTVLVFDIDTPSGNAVVMNLSENQYRMAYDRASKASHSTIFTKSYRDNPCSG
jgi:Glycosyl transferases group 1